MALDMTDSRGFGSLHLAAKNGNTFLVGLLLQSNPDLAFSSVASTTTALFWAALYGRDAVINEIIKRTKKEDRKKLLEHRDRENR